MSTLYRPILANWVYRIETELGFVLVRAAGAASAEIKAKDAGYDVQGGAGARLAEDSEIAWAKEMGAGVLA